MIYTQPTNDIKQAVMRSRGPFRVTWCMASFKWTVDELCWNHNPRM